MSRLSQVSRSTLFLIGLLITWELAARLGPWPDVLFPAPLEVGKTLLALAQDGQLAAAVVRSFGRLLQGYVISVAIGLPLGILTARSLSVRAMLRPAIAGLQALPSICWLPLSILWFGLDEGAILFVVVMGSVLSVAIATEDGIRSIEPQLLRVAGTLGIRGWRYAGGVLLAGGLPGIVTGLKLGWSFAWRALMAGELLFAAGGLGQLLMHGRELLNVPQVMAVMATIMIVGVLVDRVVFQTVENKVRTRWGLVAVT